MAALNFFFKGESQQFALFKEYSFFLTLLVSFWLAQIGRKKNKAAL